MSDNLGFMRPAPPVSERIEEVSKRIDLQTREFDALSELKDRYNDICLTSVIDDDYPPGAARIRGRAESFYRGLEE